MKNPFESIKQLIVKRWSEAPTSASRDLLELFHTSPRLDPVRIIANKCASTELYLYDKTEFRKNKSNAENRASYYCREENYRLIFRSFRHANLRDVVPTACLIYAG